MAEGDDPQAALATLTPLADQPEPEESVRSLLLKVLGAVGTGIGVVGFVTFFGGALVWLRAKEAGLPADEAVAVVPKAVLVSMGASYLVPALLIALGAVAVIGAIHLVTVTPAQVKAVGERQKAKEMRFKANVAIRDAEPEEKAAATARELATKLSENFEQARSQETASTTLQALEAAAVAQQQTAQEREQTAAIARGTAEAADTAARDAEAALETALADTPQRERVRRLVEGGVSVVILAIIPLVTYRPDLGELSPGAVILLFAFAIGAAGLSFAAYVIKEKFLWLGLVAFIGVAGYTACATYLRTTTSPKVEPVAVLREGHEPFTGLFVADTESNIYVGTFNEPGDPPHLRVIPRSQVTDLTVGRLLGVSEARREAVQLAVHECKEIVEVTDGQSRKQTGACTKPQLGDLESRLRSR